MSDIINPQHEELIAHIFQRCLIVLKMPGFQFKALRRKKRGRGKFNKTVYGYTKLGQKMITIDLYTPRTAKPRKIDAIIRVIAHELAHHQQPPRYFLKGFKLVKIIHHPYFWQQYKKNILLFQKDVILRQYFKK